MGRGLASCVGTLALVALAVGRPASAVRIFWSDDAGSIHRTVLDGGAVTTEVLSGLVGPDA